MQLNSNRGWLRESRGEKWRDCQKVVRENGGIAEKSWDFYAFEKQSTYNGPQFNLWMYPNYFIGSKHPTFAVHFSLKGNPHFHSCSNFSLDCCFF